uniref:Uncharacterized protein n=1 Tax=Anguilla anguilla TaxID=7936 RepID=A0A0E9V7K5_ANGAN
MLLQNSCMRQMCSITSFTRSADTFSSCRLFCRWLMMAARMVATFITCAHCARPRANSSFQHAFIRLMLLSWPRAWKAGIERAQCIDRKSSREADSQM